MTKLSVKNLQSGSTRQSVRSLFERYGAVERIRLNSGTTNPHRVIAFVEMADAGAATQAIGALDGSTCLDQVLSVAVAAGVRSLPKHPTD